MAPKSADSAAARLPVLFAPAGAAFAGGLADPRAGLVQHQLRAAAGLEPELPEARIDFFWENAASMVERDVPCLSRLVFFESFPVNQAGDFGRVKRPRLHWASQGLLPTLEAESTVVMARSVEGARSAWRAQLMDPRPPSGERACGHRGALDGPTKPFRVAASPFQFRGKWRAHWPHGRVGLPCAWVREKLMGFQKGHAAPCTTSSEAKAEPDKHGALCKSSVDLSIAKWWLGWSATGRQSRARWPPRRRSRSPAPARAPGAAAADWAGGAALVRRGREEFAERRFVALGKHGASAHVLRGPRRWAAAASRRGNPFAVAPRRPREDAVAVDASWLQSQPQQLEAQGELRGAPLLCRRPPELPRQADVLLAELAKRGHAEWRDTGASRSIAPGPATARHRNGADLKAEGIQKFLPKRSPGRSLTPSSCSGERQGSWRGGAAQHINVLECQGALMAMQWRARSVARQQRAGSRLVDRTVNVVAFSRRRSSSRQLNQVARSISAWKLANSASSAKNPTGSPSRFADGRAARAGPWRLGDAQVGAQALKRCPRVAQQFVHDVGQGNYALSGVYHLLETREIALAAAILGEALGVASAAMKVRECAGFERWAASLQLFRAARRDSAELGAMRGALRGSQWRAALELLQGMRQRWVEPSAVTELTCASMPGSSWSIGLQLLARCGAASGPGPSMVADAAAVRSLERGQELDAALRRLCELLGRRARALRREIEADADADAHLADLAVARPRRLEDGCSK
ncbi:unnamed protein product [Prorocentrum cordatum]|uniref:Uncharacterized protein n=1 Tax=Prorocentrum cordatum TaxID=2364126 RepID=A0ABN9PC53_9DINO|nr:unnamed protein product [Polarella glacialis]